jgi:hypothetical protein
LLVRKLRFSIRAKYKNSRAVVWQIDRLEQEIERAAVAYLC